MRAGSKSKYPAVYAKAEPTVTGTSAAVSVLGRDARTQTEIVVIDVVDTVGVISWLE